LIEGDITADDINL